MMARILEVLLVIQVTTSLIFAVLGIYQLLVCIIGLTKKKISKEYKFKEHKFMAVIPAHNEEKVIEDIIESLKKQDYKKGYVDIYVIADNCTDKTAQIARDKGAFVYERFDSEKKTKGYALEWFFNQILETKPDEYDAFCVFDADNIVSKDFFKEMNKKLCGGEKIVQGYRDIKNAEDTWVTANYALFYWVMNRCYHYSRYKLGLSPLINGTGFMVSMSVLKEMNGWHSKTITEDIEISLLSIARGYKIGWAKDAIVYDEQPLGFRQSWTQRLRWSVGHIQCFKEYFSEVAKQKDLTPTMVDAGIYIFGMPMLLISIVNFILTAIVYSLVPYKFFVLNEILKVISIVTIVGMALLSILSLIHDKKSLKKIWKGIVTAPAFFFSWTIINIIAFTQKKIEWKPIEHVKSKKMYEIQ
jgi:cellulose synthase/poly-beta-1,6-N-acetylglucosamine synthase-like glycosyltransferase